MKDLHCMSYTSRGTAEILVAGLQQTMFILDVEKGTITKEVRSIPAIALSIARQKSTITHDAMAMF
jgi:PAB-dependent poly(A)-specific ribonuclease subunit 2